MRRMLVLLAALLLAACSAGTGTVAPASAPPTTPAPTPEPTTSPTPTASPAPTTAPTAEPTLGPRPDWMDRTPSPECLNPPPDLMAVIFNSEPLACYGAAELTADALVDQVGVVDWAFASCEPAWLCEPSWDLVAIVEQADAGSIVLAVSSGPVGRLSGWPPPDMMVAVLPQSGITDQDLLSLVYPEPVPVSVTGHFDDPAALTCSFSGSDDIAPEDSITICRNTFVVTGITPDAG